MNPKDQIHYDIAELLEKIAHLNIKLASTAKIHPVELDLLRSYLRELDKLADSMPLMQLPKPSFSAPLPTAETNTLPSFNTPEEAPAAPEQTAEETVPTLEDVAGNATEEPETDPLQQTEAPEEHEEVPVYVEDVEIPTAPETEPQELETPIDTTPEPEEPSPTQDFKTYWKPDAEAPMDTTPEPEEQPDYREPWVAEKETEPALAVENEEQEAQEEPWTLDEPEQPVDTTPEPEELPTYRDTWVAEKDIEPIAPAAEPQTTETASPALEQPEPDDNATPPPSAEEPVKRSLNDLFTRGEQQDLGSKFQFQNRRNLREMIDLSERYIFTKELFGGDTDYYDRAIRQLNQLESLADAQAFINNELRPKYNWGAKEQVEKQFTKIVERRFA